MTNEQSLLDELRYQISHPDTSGAPYVNDEELLARCLAEIERLRAALERISAHCDKVRGGAPPRIWVPALVRETLGSAVEPSGVVDGDEIGAFCPKHPVASYVRKYGCPSCAGKARSYPLPKEGPSVECEPHTFQDAFAPGTFGRDWIDPNGQLSDGTHVKTELVDGVVTVWVNGEKFVRAESDALTAKIQGGVKVFRDGTLVGPMPAQEAGCEQWACANAHMRYSDPSCRVCFPVSRTGDP